MTRNPFSARLPSSGKSARPDRFVGEMRLDVEASASPLSALIDFAANLVLSAVRPGLASHLQLQETGCHASLFGSVPAGTLRGEAIALHQGEKGSNWQVTIHDSKGTTVSVVSLGYATVPTHAGNAAQQKDPAVSLPPDNDQTGKSAVQLSTNQRRAAIAAVAADVIARKGFANATMREIADAAGMHVPTMYQYVSSKDEVLELVYEWTMARVRTDVAQATVNCTTATEKLRATITSLVDKGDRFRRDIGVLNRELKSLSSEARARVLDDYRNLLAQLAELIREGIAGGEFRAVEPEIAANFIEATCDIWPLRQFEVKRFGRTAFRDQVEDLILCSLKV